MFSHPPWVVSGFIFLKAAAWLTHLRKPLRDPIPSWFRSVSKMYGQMGPFPYLTLNLFYVSCAQRPLFLPIPSTSCFTNKETRQTLTNCPLPAAWPSFSKCLRRYLAHIVPSSLLGTQQINVPMPVMPLSLDNSPAETEGSDGRVAGLGPHKLRPSFPE